MFDLAHVDDLVEHQDRGAVLVIEHPLTGEMMADISLTIAGPDSATARLSRIKYNDELMTFSGRVPAVELERLNIERLARLVVAWDVKRNGEPVAFTFTNVTKLLYSAQFVREQVEKFSASRGPYFMRTA